MTPEEHEKLQLEMTALAQDVMLEFLTTLLRKMLAVQPPEERSHALSATERKLREAREEYSTMTLGNLHPAMSDLKTALFQEAFDDLAKKTMDELSRWLTPEELRAIGNRFLEDHPHLRPPTRG